MTIQPITILIPTLPNTAYNYRFISTSNPAHLFQLICLFNRLRHHWDHTKVKLQFHALVHCLSLYGIDRDLDILVSRIPGTYSRVHKILKSTANCNTLPTALRNLKNHNPRYPDLMSLNYGELHILQSFMLP